MPVTSTLGICPGYGTTVHQAAGFGVAVWYGRAYLTGCEHGRAGNGGRPRPPQAR
jgi:hypothetical protein